MRIRSIKPEFFSDQTLASWSPLARLIYIGLWCMADDAGRFPADVDSVRAAVAVKDRQAEVEKAMEEIRNSKKILIYEESSEKFGVICNWWHQVINRPQRPLYRCPPDQICESIIRKALSNPRFRSDNFKSLSRMFIDSSSTIHGILSEYSLNVHANDCPEQGTGNREQGTVSPQPPAVRGAVGAADCLDPERSEYGTQPLWVAYEKLKQTGKFPRMTFVDFACLCRGYEDCLIENVENVERLVAAARTDPSDRISSPAVWLPSWLTRMQVREKMSRVAPYDEGTGMRDAPADMVEVRG